MIVVSRDLGKNFFVMPSYLTNRGTTLPTMLLRSGRDRRRMRTGRESLARRHALRAISWPTSAAERGRNHIIGATRLLMTFTTSGSAPASRSAAAA